MSTQAISNIPIMATRALGNATLRMISWLGARIVRNPLLSAIVVVMSVGAIASLNNALFLQKQAHPSPFFAPKQEVALVQDPVFALDPKPQILPVSTQAISTPTQITPQIAPVPATSEAVSQIDHAKLVLVQKKLVSMGFFNGVVDGFYGPKTASAIRAFENSVGKSPVGALTPKTVNDILSSKVNTFSQTIIKPNEFVNASGLLEDPIMEIVRNATNNNIQTIDVKMIKDIQVALSSLGFLHGKIDGIAGLSTSRAIREFEVFHNYKVSGEISPELLDMLLSAGAKI